MTKTLIAIFLSISSIQAFAGPDASKWSLRYLARASNALLVASNQSLDSQKVICGIAGSNVSLLSQNLKSLLDSKIAMLNNRQRAEIRNRAPSCLDECTCDIYTYHFEQSQDPQDKKLLAEISAPSEKISAEMRLTCAKKFPEFCHSQLLKAISK